MNIVSFPRSGNFLTMLLLKNFYLIKDKKFTFCNYYLCCNRTPCKFNKMFQKNHDFNLELEIKDGEKYLILYRKDMIEQLEAYFRFKRKNIVDYNNNCDYNDLIKFIKHYKQYYINFIKKYVETERDNFLVIDYNYFLVNSKNVVFDIFKFFDIECTKEEVSNFLDNREIKIKKRNHLDINFKNKLVSDLKKNNII